MHKSNHHNGKNLIRELELILNEVHRYSDMVNKHVITSTTDLNGVITSVSQAFCANSGYAEQELIGQNHNLLKHPDTTPLLFKEMWHTIQSGQSWEGEIKNLKKNGETYWVNINIDPIRNTDNEVTGYLSINRDITDHKHIESLTITDELTGAYNRRFYNQTLPVEIDRARRDKHFLCLMMIDVDNFKKYNDTYGHQEGDKVLKEIVASCKSSFQRAGDFVFRLGGEEFAVLFTVDEAEKSTCNCRTLS